MAEARWDGYSVHFAHYAGRLEQHLRRNGISCPDADAIIEASSELYFEKLQSAGTRLFKLVKSTTPRGCLPNPRQGL